ncbi:MAG: hypothetical protein HEQ26_11670 [Dolichospermum sp. DL01]|jgi:hypothetical protein|nr:MAG: hypothetical protein HEQ26_11670 [Dolichospermum sp. DL01]
MITHILGLLTKPIYAVFELIQIPQFRSRYNPRPELKYGLRHASLSGLITKVRFNGLEFSFSRL